MRSLLLVVTAGLALGLAVPALASASSSCWYSVRGCVHVQGYVKPSTGTYVRPYYRSYPGYKAPSYKMPSYRYGY